jgi:hypothetical protein
MQTGGMQRAAGSHYFTYPQREERACTTSNYGGACQIRCKSDRANRWVGDLANISLCSVQDATTWKGLTSENVIEYISAGGSRLATLRCLKRVSISKEGIILNKTLIR